MFLTSELRDASEPFGQCAHFGVVGRQFEGLLHVAAGGFGLPKIEEQTCPAYQGDQVAWVVAGSAALVAGIAYRAQPELRNSWLFAFSGVAVVVALGVLMGWGGYHGGWPEPSDVGLI